MFDWLYNMQHYDLMAWVFWIVLGLILFNIFQFSLWISIYRDLKNESKTPKGKNKDKNQKDNKKNKKKNGKDKDLDKKGKDQPTKETPQYFF